MPKFSVVVTERVRIEDRRTVEVEADDAVQAVERARSTTVPGPRLGNEISRDECVFEVEEQEFVVPWTISGRTLVRAPDLATAMERFGKYGPDPAVVEFAAAYGTDGSVGTECGPERHDDETSHGRTPNIVVTVSNGLVEEIQSDLPGAVGTVVDMDEWRCHSESNGHEPDCEDHGPQAVAEHVRDLALAKRMRKVLV